MEEEFVKDKVKNWLSRSHEMVFSTGGPDVQAENMEFNLDKPQIIFRKSVQVECKGTDADVDKALGQTLRYAFKSPSSQTYLALPEDYENLEVLHQMLNAFNLAIGLLLVKYDGTVEVKKKWGKR